MSFGELLLNPHLAAVFQSHHDQTSPPPLKARIVDDDQRRNVADDQSRVIMKFEEKRQLLQAICDRKDQLFGPLAAKMKPAQKQALWEEVIETFRRACPDSTADLSAGYVRGIFWQNLRKRTLAKKERAVTDENVKFDELDDLVAQILGDKINNTPPASALNNNNDAPTQVNYPNISDILLPVIQNTINQYNTQLNHQQERSESPQSPAPTLNNVNLDYSRFTPIHQNNEDERKSSKRFNFDEDLQAQSSSFGQGWSRSNKNDNFSTTQSKRRKLLDEEHDSDPVSTLNIARLANIEAQTARIRAETRLLELKFACECKRNNLKGERLSDGRMAFIVEDSMPESTDKISTGDEGDHSSASTSEAFDPEE